MNKFKRIEVNSLKLLFSSSIFLFFSGVNSYDELLEKTLFDMPDTDFLFLLLIFPIFVR